ncbi:MAG: histidine-type phosphatase [Alkalibacterium sp.]
MDGVFVPVLTFMNDAYEADLREEIAERGGGEGLSGYSASLRDAIRLVMDVADVEETEAYRSGAYGNLLEDETVLNLVEGKEATMTGPIKTATSLADALVLQYYEEADEQKAAFGHELSREDWKTIGSILATYEDILFASPTLAVNAANPMLRELFAELNAQGRQFSFLCGHDSTITSVLAALGVEDYELPNAIEPTTPIGSKVVFQRWVNDDGESFFKVDLVYQSVDQLRSIQPLSLEVPPMIVPLSFEGVAVNADGLIAEKDLMNLFLDKISMLPELEEAYTAAEQVLPAAA